LKLLAQAIVSVHVPAKHDCPTNGIGRAENYRIGDTWHLSLLSTAVDQLIRHEKEEREKLTNS
jgi:hypothetical protein